MLSYDPNASYEVRHDDIEYRREGSLSLVARVYRPEAPGPFPAAVALHGGAWAGKEWLQNEASHMRLAAGGMVVAALQFRTSMDAPHPAALHDVSYAVRWVKAHAAELNASPEQVGGIGWSSGGHQIMLLGMRPHDFDAIPLPEAPGVDARLAYVVLGWPVIDPLSRYHLAQSGSMQPLTGDISQMLQRHLAYFGDEAAMTAVNPQLMLERGEAVELPPAIILQGGADLQLTRGMAEAFVEAYSRAGGVIELGKYPGEPHGFMRQPGPNTDRAFGLLKSFLQRQLAVVAVPA